MRRGATLFVAIGLTLTGFGVCSAAPAGARTGDPAAASGTATLQLAGRAGAARQVGATKVVRYRGYAMKVPAGWPVYRLDRDPTRCVRFDRHAVYLGTPGADQLCPAHLVGRVGTISLQPSGAAPGTLASGPMWHPASPVMGLAQGVGGSRAAVLQDSTDQVLRTVLRSPAMSVTATYGADAPVVAGIIRSLRRTATSAPAQTPATPQRTSTAGGVINQTASLNRTGRWGVHKRLARHAFVGMLKGFDACTAPSLSTMSKWRPYFGAVAVYIGGPEAACGYGNLSPTWIRQVTAMGWSLIPTYVGPQAPCNSFHTRIRLGRAHATGQQAADDAIKLAKALGLGPGAPIYDDMEWYKSGRGICRRQVLSFLNGWTRELRSRGYVPGVYSSAAAAARDLGRTKWIYGKWLAKPNTLWFALWDGHANLEGAPYLASSWWPAGRRIKQYQGAHQLRLAGATVNIDSDMVYGAVYR